MKATQVCSIDGCGHGGKLVRGWCHRHYSRWQRHGDPLAGRAFRDSIPETCSVDGCQDAYEARGFCNKHWLRWWRYGDPFTVNLIVGDDEARFWSKVDKGGPLPADRPELGACWSWTDHHTNGYARFWANGRVQLAYRWAYERFVAPVPNGLELDHLCRNRGCVNFERHLEPVTHLENMRRRYSLPDRLPS